MICVPIGADQPLVSYRLSDELGVAVSISRGSSIVSTRVRNALQKILDDKQYFVRVDRLAIISHEYPGYSNGAKLIMDFLEKKSD